MLYIDSSKKHNKDLAETHFRAILCAIRRRVGSSIKCSSGCNICKGGPRKRQNVLDTWKLVLEDEAKVRKIVLAKPKKLLEESEILLIELLKVSSYDHLVNIKDRKKAYKSDQEKKIADRQGVPDVTKSEEKILSEFAFLSKIIDYNEWFNKLPAHAQYGPYKMAEELNLRSCTYCNRQYTITVKSKTNKSNKLTRPQFDHWIAKEAHPLLGLSFYNLIPSCPTCNSSVKGSIRFNTREYTNPYIDNVIDQIQFRFEYWASMKKYNVHVEGKHLDTNENNKIERTLQAFKIQEVYNGHHPELNDLVQLSKAYSPQYLSILKASFPKANLTDDQFYRYAFGTELESSNFHKRPMSKFKHDILKQLNII